MIDLRSDTVSLPSDGMRAAMAAAIVGDSQFDEDPSVNKLQDELAELFGCEKALFLPSGTMANQIALMVLTSPGDDVLVADEAHIVWHEAGASAVNAGVQFTTLGRAGIFDGDDVSRIAKPRGHRVFPATTLAIVENTHNRFGGIIFPENAWRSVLDTSRLLGLSTYLDGARIFNVAVATGQPVRQLTSGFDLVSVSLSKGLGCPVGSVLLGSESLISKALPVRRRLGGAMRQAGILAAAGSYALVHNIARLAEDHSNALRIASNINNIDGVKLDINTVQTNIIVFHLDDGMPSAIAIAERLKNLGVLVGVFGPQTIRIATHLNITAADAQKAAEAIRGVLIAH